MFDGCKKQSADGRRWKLRSLYYRETDKNVSVQKERSVGPFKRRKFLRISIKFGQTYSRSRVPEIRINVDVLGRPVYSIVSVSKTPNPGPVGIPGNKKDGVCRE